MNKLKLNKDVYNELMVTQSIDAFTQIVDIGLEISLNYFICSFSNSKYDLDETMKEFENYLIDLTNHSKNYDNN